MFGKCFSSKKGSRRVRRWIMTEVCREVYVVFVFEYQLG